MCSSSAINGVHELLHVDADVELVQRGRADVLQILERGAADDGARRLVGYAEHELPAAFVRERGEVLERLVGGEARLGLLELEVLVLVRRDFRGEISALGAIADGRSADARVLLGRIEARWHPSQVARVVELHRASLAFQDGDLETARA